MDSNFPFGSGGVLFVVLFIAIAVLVVMAVIAANRREQERREALFSFALANGLQVIDPDVTYAPQYKGFWDSIFNNTTADEVFVSRFEGFEPFGIGSNREAYNLIVGSRDGADWYMFDYEYKTSSGKDTTTHHYAIIAARVPYVFPRLDLRPENFLTRLGQNIGFRELKFELDEFNQRYYVTCGDEKEAYDILSPQMIEYLMRQEIRAWQFFGPYIVITDFGLLTADNCYRVMREVKGFLALLPNYVRQDLGFKPTWSNALE